jgi:hypothetical protein
VARHRKPGDEGVPTWDDNKHRVALVAVNEIEFVQRLVTVPKRITVVVEAIDDGDVLHSHGHASPCCWSSHMFAGLSDSSLGPKTDERRGDLSQGRNQKSRRARLTAGIPPSRGFAVMSSSECSTIQFMRLITIWLEGYKRFQERTKINFDGKLIALVGPNEAGKTTVLSALGRLNDDGAITLAERTRPSNPADDDVAIEALWLVEEADLERIHIPAGCEPPRWLSGLRRKYPADR